MKTTINKTQYHKNNLSKTKESNFWSGKNIGYLGILTLLLITTFYTFSASFENEFVNWDDQVYVEEQPLVLNKEYSKLLKTPVSLNYHPLTMISLAAQAPKNKKDLSAKPFIQWNVWLHIFNTFLAFLLIWLLTNRMWFTALFSAAVFAIHPSHVESVVWVSERKDVLHTFFLLLSCIVYWKYLKEKTYQWLVFAFALFVLAVLSKATAVVLPLLLLLIDYWSDRKLTDKKVIFEKLPFFAISLFFGLMAVSVQGGGDFGGMLNLYGEKTNALGDFNVFTLFQRIQFACYGYITYIVNFFNPTKLSAFYPYPESNSLSSAQGILYPFLTLALLLGSLWSTKKTKVLVFGIGFYTVSVALVLQFLSVGVAMMADRYTYVPYIGLGFLVFYAFEKYIEDKKAVIKYAAIFGGCLFLVYLKFKTDSQIKVWKNSESLWTQVLKYFPKEDLALANRGNYLGKIGNIEGALSDFEKAVSDGCKRADVYEGLGNSYGTLSERNPENSEELIGKAIEMYEKALTLEPNKGNIHFNLGVAQMQTNPASSVLAFKKALELMPYKDFEILPPLGLTLLNSGQYQEAVNTLTTAFSKGIQTDAMLYHRGLANIGIGKNDDAVADFNQALVINPNYAEVKERLAMMGY